MLGKWGVIFDQFLYRNSTIFIQQVTSNKRYGTFFDTGLKEMVLPMMSFLHDQGAILDQ